MIVTARDFRANQTKYIGIAHSGEDVILKSRAGSVRLMPVDTVGAIGKAESKKEKNHREATLKKARALTSDEIADIEQKEFVSLEELRLLLYRTVDINNYAHAYQKRR